MQVVLWYVRLEARDGLQPSQHAFVPFPHALRRTMPPVRVRDSRNVQPGPQSTRLLHVTTRILIEDLHAVLRMPVEIYSYLHVLLLSTASGTGTDLVLVVISCSDWVEISNAPVSLSGLLLLALLVDPVSLLMGVQVPGSVYNFTSTYDLRLPTVRTIMMTPTQCVP